MTVLTEDDCLLPVYNTLPFEPVLGEGLHLFDHHGKCYLDFYGGHAVALLGYNHPALVNTLALQAQRLFFQSNIVDLEIRREAASKLLAFSRTGLSRVFFINSGAEANENALRLAFRKTGRKKVVALNGGFHGRTAAAAGATSYTDKWYGFPNRPFEITRVDVEDKDAINREVTDDTAAVILEPVMGMAGAVALSADYLKHIRKVTDDVGAVLIFDEVQSGMGRTGAPFGATMAGVTPDLLTVAKGLAGGFPAGAVLTTESFADLVSKGDLGTTFGGGPMACALIIAVIDAIEREDLMANVRRGSELIRSTCKVGPVLEITGEGYLLGLRTSIPARKVQKKLIDSGILTGLSKDPNIVRLLPPLTLGETEIALLRDALIKVKG